MALTRKMLTAMDIAPEKVDEIINAHTETVNALKEQGEVWKADAAKVPDLEKELAAFKKKVEDAEKSDWEKKYTDLKAEFDGYKKDVEGKQAHADKEAAYKQLLIDAGVSEKRLASILRVSSVDEVELDKEGKIKGSDKLTEKIKEEWADFIVEKREQGANVSNPPAGKGSGSVMTKDDILKIRDTAERQAAMREHADLFGIEK